MNEASALAIAQEALKAQHSASLQLMGCRHLSVPPPFEEFLRTLRFGEAGTTARREARLRKPMTEIIERYGEERVVALIRKKYDRIPRRSYWMIDYLVSSDEFEGGLAIAMVKVDEATGETEIELHRRSQRKSVDIDSKG